MRISLRWFVVLLACVLVAPSAFAQCDDRFVTVKGKQVSVVPDPIGEDTPNLQCALDLGASLGPGASVQLAAGDFDTAQLVVKGFRGRISGAGQGVTTVHNVSYPLPIEHPCAPEGLCFMDAPPSSTNHHPSLVSILGTDVTISDVSLFISGLSGTQLWHFRGSMEGDMYLASNVVQILGSGATVRFDRVAIDNGSYYPLGFDAQGNPTGFFGDAAACGIVWSFGQPELPTDTTVTVDHSNLGGAFNVLGLRRGRASVANSRFELSNTAGAYIGDVQESRVAYKGNEFVAMENVFASVFISPQQLGTGPVNSTIHLLNNTFGGQTAIFAVPGATKNTRCLAANNDVGAVAAPYVMLNDACRVVAAH